MCIYLTDVGLLTIAAVPLVSLEFSTVGVESDSIRMLLTLGCRIVSLSFCEFFSWFLSIMTLFDFLDTFKWQDHFIALLVRPG